MGIRRFIKILQIRKTLFLQLLFVIMAFVMMVGSSNLYVRKMLQNHLRRDATDLLTQAKLKIEAEFIEPQTALLTISETIRSMIIHGDSVEEIHESLKRIGGELKNKPNGFTYDDLYGYFEVFDGVFLTALDFEIPEDFDPTDRPWYTTAVSAGGKIAVTPIYASMRLNDYMITYVRQIFDNNGQTLGVIGLNVPIQHIRNYVADIKLTKESYVILHDEHLNIYYHPDPQIIGRNQGEIDSGVTSFYNEVLAGSDLFEREANNYTGNLSIIFSTRLENSWILYIVTPKNEYYQEVWDLDLILIVLGILFTLPLCLILISVDSAKKKADEGSRQKSVQLALIEKIKEADERILSMFNSTPLGCNLWNSSLELIECNREVLNLFDLPDKQIYFKNFYRLSPECQPCGRVSTEMAEEYVRKAFDEGYCRFEWTHQKLNGELIPSEITLVRIKDKEGFLVSGYIRDLREHNQMINKIEYRDNLLNMVNHTAIVLLQTESNTNMMSSVVEGMQYLGLALDVDRVQIWQNEMIEGVHHFVHKYEWLSNFGQQKSPVPIGIKFPYSDMPEWEKKFFRDQCINGPLRELPQSDQDFLGSFDIKTIVIIPLFLQDRFWGLFSIDDCRLERTFSEEEINILRSAGLLIANAFLRNDMMQNIHSGAVQLENALKAAQDANTAKSKFLANMSHEIRTPMNVILGVTERQLENENHPKQVKEAFENIYNSSDLLLHIINDILDLSKIEAGKFEVIPVKYEILSLINDTATLSMMRYGKKQIKFQLHADENLPLYLFGDELRIKQIANNLLSNAFKYTDAGEVLLSYTAENTTQDNTILVICVRDTGQGMTEEQVSKLFDEYSRFNLEANRTTTGTGLGMTITNNLVKMMNGTISIESTPGAGSTFTVRIPQKITDSGLLGRDTMESFQKFHFTDRIRKGRFSINREPMPYGKVLIVDDMKSNLDVARLLLEPYELQLDIANSGYEAIEKIKNGKIYDIVFMDHMMPKMDGIEATNILRNAGYKHPIIALTANAVAGQQEIFLAKGFDGYISKPIDLRQLNNSLNKFVRDKKRSLENSGEDVTQDFAGSAVSALKNAEEETAEFQAGIPADIPVIDISEVDTKTGLALYGDDMNIYLSVLRSFVPNALSNMEKMHNVTEESIQDYAVIVHGMKSISANIGAEKLRETAFNLEKLAKAENLAGVLAKNKAFLKYAENITSNVQAWLKEYDALHTKPQLEFPDTELLGSLCKCCEAYDIDGIDDIMDQMEGVDYKSDASLIKWLREKINQSDFSSAAKRISAYLGEKK